MKSFKSVMFGLVATATGLIHADNIKIAIIPPYKAAVEDAAMKFEKATGHTVEIVIPSIQSVDELLALYMQWVASSTPPVDAMMLDVIWPGIFKNFVADAYDYIPKQFFDPFLDTIVNNDTIQGKMFRVAGSSDAGVIYYRKDLLEKYKKPVPTTWAEMADTAKFIMMKEREAGNANMWGFTTQGKANEGMVCNALEIINGYGGGTYIDANGQVTINNPKAKEAIQTWKSFIGTISPESTLTDSYEESRAYFAQGNAVFHRNWPYAYAASSGENSPVRGKIGVIPIPSSTQGKPGQGTQGGWGFGVLKKSQNTKTAMEWAKFFANYENAEFRAANFSIIPPRSDVYDSDLVRSKQPNLIAMKEALIQTVARPSTVTGKFYGKVSSEISNHMHEALSGNLSIDEAFSQLEARLNEIKPKWDRANKR